MTTSPEVIEFVYNNNGHPKIPENCPSVMQDVLSNCWNFNPEARPSFAYLSQFFEELTNDDSLLEENLLPSMYISDFSVVTLTTYDVPKSNSDQIDNAEIQEIIVG